MDQDEAPSSPPLCAAGCGFFGNPACESFCSKCYRDLKKGAPSAPAPSLAPIVAAAQPSPVRQAVPVPVSVSPVAPVAAAAAAAAAAGGGDDGSADSPKKAKASRCYTCRAKVGLLGFKCRCEQEFCPKHRHADEHSCPFDYKTFDRDNLVKANPVIQAQKINKI